MNANENHKPFIIRDRQSFTLTLPNLLYKPGIKSYSVFYLAPPPKGKHILDLLSHPFNKGFQLKNQKDI